MAKPIMVLLNPIEIAIEDFQAEPKAVTAEVSLLIDSCRSSPQNTPKILIPKQRLEIILWFIISFAVLHSWFSFTVAIPIFQYYYRKNFLAVSSIFSVFPIIMSIALPIFSKLLAKTTDYLIPLTIAAFINALGCAIKCTGRQATGLLTVFAGQLIIEVASPLLLGFPMLLLKHHPERKWLISLLLISVTILGSISGITLLPLLIPEKEKAKDLGQSIYRYFLWNAVFGVLPLVLIPFSVKERRQLSSAKYQAFNTINEEHYEPNFNEASTSSSLHLLIHRILKQYRSMRKEKSLLIKVCSIGISAGAFLSMFTAPSLCLHLEAKRTRLLCVINSAVILTVILYFFLDFKFKLNIRNLVVVINNLLLSAAILSFAFCTGTELLPVKLFLYYLMHSSIGFDCWIYVRKVLPSSNRTNISFVMILLQGFLATVTCFLLSSILWRFSTVAWSISIGLLNIISIGCSLLPL